MDELKEETETNFKSLNQEQNLDSNLPLQGQGRTSARKPALVLVGFMAVLIIVGMVVWLFLIIKGEKTKNTSKTVIPQTTSTNLQAWNPLAELIMEPTIKPTLDKTVVSPEGATTVRRSYISDVSIDMLYDTQMFYLGKRKGWQVNEITSINPGEQKSFNATKNGYTAIIIFNKGDGGHTAVDMTLTFLLK